MEAPSRRPIREAPVPAEQPQAQEDPRVPHQDADPGWAGSASGPPPAGPGPAQRLIRRVRERETFAAFARGDRRRHGQITVTRVRLETSGPPQVAFRVGKRVGNAVTRNRVRRRLRAALQDHARAGLLDPGCAYLVGAAPPAAGAPYAELARSLGAALTDLGQAPR